MTDSIENSPVKGYTSQSTEKVELVNEFKEFEERLLRKLDFLPTPIQVDGRWVAIARTHFQEGFMALNRAVFQPQRISLPGDEAAMGE